MIYEIEVIESVLNDTTLSFPVHMGSRFGWDSLWIAAYEDVEIGLHKAVLSTYLNIMTNDIYKCDGIPTYSDIMDCMDGWFYERIHEQMTDDLEKEGRIIEDITDEEWDELDGDYLDFACYNQYWDCFHWQVSKCLSNLKLTIIDDDEDFIILNDAQIELLPEGDGRNAEEERNRHNPLYLQ